KHSVSNAKMVNFISTSCVWAPLLNSQQRSTHQAGREDFQAASPNSTSRCKARLPNPKPPATSLCRPILFRCLDAKRLVDHLCLLGALSHGEHPELREIVTPGLGELLRASLFAAFGHIGPP